jgi:hypothetical protein
MEKSKGYILLEAHSKFREFFHEPLNPYIDGMLTAISKRVVIDIDKFDEFLHRKFGQYEDQGLSMKDILIQKYSW